MQDEVNEKVVALSIKTSKLTAEVLQKAMKAILAKGKQQLSKAPHGKISMRQLMKPGEKVTNIEITDANIKAFDAIAKKNGLDYNVKRIENGKPPTYLVSFRGKDIDVMTEAFREFSAKKLSREQKPSNMMDGDEEPKPTDNSETLFARINHRLTRLYQIMQANRRKVEEERQELQTLVSDISHQVKTPVSNLKMVTDTLLTRPVTEAERIDFIKGVRSQTDKLDFLFQALVKTSRLETGVIRLEKKPGHIYDTVAQAMSGIVYGAEKKEISVSVACPDDLILSHDSKWTAEALFNLLDNAVKYTPAGGKISVTVIPWEMYVEVKVSDTGKGISESNQAAIFRRFYREEEVHDQQGVGIGLYLAREIVTRQGGYIKVVSEPEKGSEFSIMLPIK